MRGFWEGHQAVSRVYSSLTLGVSNFFFIECLGSMAVNHNKKYLFVLTRSIVLTLALISALTLFIFYTDLFSGMDLTRDMTDHPAMASLMGK